MSNPSGRSLRVLAAGATVALSLGLLSAAPGQAADYQTITSFDGTPITFYWFPAAGLQDGQQAPTVLQGPGFGGQAQDDPEARGGTSIPGVGDLRRAGYNVLTWNPRGIAPSGGEAMLDNPSYEGRDVSALIDWVAQQPQARLDGTGDPRVGMTGGSYGGGIQLATAGIDRRVDVIVPVIAWHSLGTSLYKSQTIKTAWVDTLMAGATQPGRTFSPSILKGRAEADKGMTFSPSVVDFARSAGPFNVVPEITAPTLLIQGTIDNLFPPSEALDNYRALRATGTPVKMVWFCGGHGVCLTKGGSSTLPVEQTWKWLRRYLDGDTGVDTGPGFSWIDQRGTFRTAPDYPTPTGAIRAAGQGELTLGRKGGAGPFKGKRPEGVSPITWLLISRTIPTPARNAVDVVVRGGPSVVLGAPVLKLRYRGQSKSKKVRVLAQVTDKDLVVGNQITPIPVRLDGKTHSVRVSLEPISMSLRKGQRLKVQLVAQSSAYDVYPKSGKVRFSRIRVSLPTVG